MPSSHYRKLSETSNSTMTSATTKSSSGTPSLTTQSSKSAQSLERPLSYDEIIASGTDKQPPIGVDDRIVWISDTGPEFGIVKWLGKLPDQCDEWMAGVEFVNPIGTGTGEYNRVKLFNTPVGHASLVPIVGLLKAQDFLGTINIEEHFPPPRTPSRRHKQKQQQHPQQQQHSSKFYVDSGDSPNKSSSSNELTNRTSTPESPEMKSFHISKMSETQLPRNPPKYHEIDLPRVQTVGNSKFLVPAPSSQSNELYEIGSMVEFDHDSCTYHGVIRWLGILHPDEPIQFESVRKTDENVDLISAGVELDDEEIGCTDGTFNGKRYFDCPNRRAFFVLLSKCTIDNRYASSVFSSLSHQDANNSGEHNDHEKGSKYFGGIDCPVVMGNVDSLTTKEQFDALLGKNRGIQGHHNSCYLDATLFSMFCSATVFDSLLNRPQNSRDIQEYSEVQKILKEEIVNPLRTNYYVRADRVMKLRLLLEKISSMRGLTCEEKDPEEFIDMLLAEVLKTDPFLKLSTGLNSFCYQLFVEKDDTIAIPTVQQLFEQSFYNSDIKLKQIPPCLILQMPRFGRQFKTYPRIMPSLYLDVTNVLDNSPRVCTVCGDLAEFECKDCFGKHGDGLESVSYCKGCFVTYHSVRNQRDDHRFKELHVPESFKQLKNHTRIPHVMMELFAVLCIETSHYVSFVKCGSQKNAPWCFFDSMADRRGGQNGYNIPEITAFNDMEWWLGEDGREFLLQNKDDKALPELPRRLLSDAYICFYSSEVQRYR